MDKESPTIEEMTHEGVQAHLVAARLVAQAAACNLLVSQHATRPSSLYMPMIYHDGLQWVAWYGGIGEEIKKLLPEGAMEYGVKAMGATPAEALMNFDSQWSGSDK